MRATQWFRPILTKRGFFPSFSGFLPPLAAIASASLSRRAFFSCLVSGLYLLRRRKSWVAVFLSKVLENWAIAGGTLKAVVEDGLLPLQADVFGPLDKACEVACGLNVLACGRQTGAQRLLPCHSKWEQACSPIPKFLGVFSKRGLVCFFVGFLASAGARAAFFAGAYRRQRR